MDKREWYWATLKDNGWKVIVTNDPSNNNKCFGFFLPEWIKDGRVRRKFKEALRVEFVCNNADVILGNLASVEQSTHSKPVYEKQEYSDSPITPIGFQWYQRLIIDGVDYSRDGFVANV